MTAVETIPATDEKRHAETIAAVQWLADPSHVGHHIGEVLEDLRVGDLTTEVLEHLLANRRAREAHGPPPPMEWERRERTIQDRAFRFAQWARAKLDADEDLIGCDLMAKLLRLGYSDDDAAEILRDVDVPRGRRSAEARS